MIVENKIIVRLYLLLMPIAFISYLFHEFGHWTVGEILGNEMILSLNYCWPKAGHYINESHDLYVGIGGPAFTILLAMFSLLILEKYLTILPTRFYSFNLYFAFSL